MLEKAKKALEETLNKKQSNFLLPLDLQLFSDDPTDPVDPPADPQDPPADPDPVDPPTPPAGKTFTQEDVNAIAAKEAKKATEKLLKQLGVTDFKTAKEGLDQFKKHQDSQKTDAQKALDQAKLLSDENATLSSTVGTLTAQLAAFKAGVNSESLEDVIVLANNLVNDDTTIDDAIVQVLTKYPHFKAVQQEEKQEDKKQKPKFTDGEHKNKQKQSDSDAWTSAFNFGGTIK